jgi:hypothetical protein
MDKCAIKRTADFEQRRQAAQAAGGTPPVAAAAGRAPQADEEPEAADPMLGASVEADCTLEWVTIATADQSGNLAVRPAQAGQTGARKP